MIRTLAGVFVALCAATATAHAFCGFYVAGSNQPMFNDATQVVLMREGTRTVLSMQNNYKGPPDAFAMVDPGAGRPARGRRQDAAQGRVRARRADGRAAARRVLGAGPVRAADARGTDGDGGDGDGHGHGRRQGW